MKIYLLGVYLFLFTGIIIKAVVPHPKFTVGDCIQLEGGSAERWEKNQLFIHKVEEIGNKHYRLSYVAPSFMKNTEYQTQSFAFDSIYEKVECPK